MQSFFEDVLRNINSPLCSLILQILSILVVARLCGLLIRRLGQPQVVGEILAGIFLGPSLLQPLAPEIHAFLFPQGSVQRLYFLSQIGILLFMFVVGLELDTKLIRSKMRSAILISQVSIVFPFVLGATLAFFSFAQFGPHDKGLAAYVLFMGIAMSITAFPVLARIIQEQGLTRTHIGAMAISCAAVDDVTAWCLLALVTALAQARSGFGALGTVLLTAVYAAFMLIVVRAVLARRAYQLTRGSELSTRLLTFAFIALLISAWITEMIGIHALFGAFLMGVVMPEQNQFKEKLAARIQDVTTAILLPLFFAFTGLRTQVGLLNDSSSWALCGLVLLCAITGKFGGAMLAARFTGHDWRTSTVLGALMNTRGLVELIVLNLGYDLGILSPKVFTIMVIMAVITTMMAGPIVRILLPRHTETFGSDVPHMDARMH